MNITKPTAVFYEANAGTGKTTELTGYILDAIQNGVSLQRICALTFTLKAANEMLDRLRSRVAELVSRGTLDPVQMQLAGRCFVGTIHAFCLQLLKRYAPELSLPPIFEVDGMEEKFDSLFENRWDEYLSRLLLSSVPAQQAVIRDIGVTTLRSLAEILVSTRHELQEPADDDIGWLVEDVSNAKKWNSKKGSWSAFANELVKDYEINRGVLTAMIVRRNIGRRDLAVRIRDILNCKTTQIYNAIRLLMSDFVRPFLAEYHGSGYIRYEDLIVFTRKLLENRNIRREVKERYDLILVDEMQDTDALQYEIILCLCEKKDQHRDLSLREILKGEQKLELEPGKLFVVGDPKQSIYGFRNADLSAYASVKDALHKAGAEIRPLTGNYRSCSNLVDFTNKLARVLFSDMEPEESMPAQKNLCKDNSAADCIHLVRIFSPDSDRTHLRILSEANWIAQKIRKLVDEKKASYRDFGVLLRKLVNSHLYVDSLAAWEIPVVIEGERFFYRSQEIIDFINLLKCIVDPADETALAGTLRSPLFGMTDPEIASFFHAYREKFKDIPEAIAVALPESRAADTLQLMLRIFDIRKNIHAMNALDLVEAVLEKFPVLSIAGLAYGSYRNTVAPMNLLRIYRHAAEVRNDPGYNLFHFVSTLTQFCREGKERAQEPLADEGLDAVRMMSIHNSKGLDFPLVFVPLTDYETRQSAFAFTDIVHEWATNTTGLKVNGTTEANYLRLKYGGSELLAGDMIDVEEEERRVLYVASTRAKQEVYFCCLDNGTGKGVLELLQAIDPSLKIVDEASSAYLAPSTPAAVPSPTQPLQPVLEGWDRFQKLSASFAFPGLDSITQEAEKMEPGEQEWARIASEAKRAGGTLVGLLCHAVLEKWDLKDTKDIDRILMNEKGKYARNFTRARIDQAVAQSMKLLQQFSSSAAADWIRSAEVLGREVPVVYFDRSAARILSGKIDLLARAQGLHWIVDYKTDTAISDTMLRRYTQQMRFYREALSRTFPHEMKARLLLIRTGEIIDL